MSLKLKPVTERVEDGSQYPVGVVPVAGGAEVVGELVEP
jgi:hypothetical protein